MSKYFIGFTVFAVAFSGGLIGLPTAHAAPSFIVTWKARSYAPLSYVGKALPSAGTTIDVTMGFLEKNKIISLLSHEVRWYVNDKLASKGIGRTAFAFTAPRTGEDAVQVRINLPNYQGHVLDEFITIPIVRPEVVIDQTRLPTLEPLFYFFNITNPSSLETSWEEERGLLTFRAVNINNPIEFAQTIARYP